MYTSPRFHVFKYAPAHVRGDRVSVAWSDLSDVKSNMQIVTGIEVNSEAYFPKLREYCPSAKGTRAIFPQLREISLTIDLDASHYLHITFDI